MNAGGSYKLMIARTIIDPNPRPGDHVFWKSDRENRTAVVQVVNPSQRVATLKLTDVPESSPQTEIVSLLELDPHGTHDTTGDDLAASPDELGVHRGEFVFIHREGTTNGCVTPRVPKIGELESWIQEVPSLHTMQPGGFTDVIYTEGLKIIMTEENWRDGRSTFIPTGVPVNPVQWFGYVSDVSPLWSRVVVTRKPDAGTYRIPQLTIDGRIEVSLPHGEKVLVPLQRLTRLYDGLDQLEDMLEDGFPEEESSMEDVSLEGEEWPGASDGVIPLHPHLMSPHFGGGADAGEVDGNGGEGEETQDSMISDTMDAIELDPPQIPGGLPVDDTSMTPQMSPTPDPYGTSTPQPASQPHESLRDLENGDLYWKRFDILPSAPADHAFYNRFVAQPSRAFMVRLHKEYRALSTGLPGTLTLDFNADPTPIPHQPRL